jgi:hypothetical protein
MRLFIGCVLLSAILAAQAPQADITGIPESRGVYYHTPSGWIGLPANPLLAFQEGSTRWLLGVGRGDAIAEIPGLHSQVQIPSSRPIFHLRGYSGPNAFYLVRETPKQDYREIRMPYSHDFHNWAGFRAKDLVDLDLSSAGNGILTLTPKTDLAPGEYAIVSLAEPSMRGIRLSFDFGVAGH